ncbi:hypothetical protein TNCV_3203931 [Trichonephila clavipes]|nr:hypothetical protein TNCV_3203931 [Trichonephila clavipes]
MPRAHQAGLSRRSLAGVGLSESVRCHEPGLALLTNEGMQQQQHESSLYMCLQRTFPPRTVQELTIILRDEWGNNPKDSQ